jgi:hypothetical protein
MSSFQMSLRYSAFEKVSVASMLLSSVGDPGFKESEPEAFSTPIIESMFDADRRVWLVFQELVWCRRIFEGKEEKREYATTCTWCLVAGDKIKRV